MEIIFSGSPHIVRTQVVPDISNNSVLIQTVLKNVTAKTSDRINFVIKEKISGKVVGSGKSEIIELDAGEEITNQTTLFFEDVHLWSPEDPFLYTLESATNADATTTFFWNAQLLIQGWLCLLEWQEIFHERKQRYDISIF